MHAGGAGSHQKKALENRGDPPRPLLRIGPLHAYDPVFNGLGELGLCTGRQLGHQPLGSLPTVSLCPALYRMAAHTELLTQHRGAVTFLQVQTHYLQPELMRIGSGPAPCFADTCLGFCFLSHGRHSFLLN